MIVYGGKFTQMSKGMWALNLSDPELVGEKAEPFLEEEESIFSTAHFMVAVLCLMLMCFFMFVTMLRRRIGAPPVGRRGRAGAGGDRFDPGGGVESIPGDVHEHTEVGGQVQ